MKKLFALALVLCMLLPFAALGEEGAAAPSDTLVATKHTAKIAVKTIDYTATAGTMVMNTVLGQYEIFYIAYTADGTDEDMYKTFSPFVNHRLRNWSQCWYIPKDEEDCIKAMTKTISLTLLKN